MAPERRGDVPCTHRLLVSAGHKSSGKTLVSVGLAAALRARGLRVQAFKKGPDYIDPMWLGAAAGRTCRNLDPFLGGDAEIRRLFAAHLGDADVALVEGNKGLHDGMSIDGSDSSAALARTLELPVLLVLDVRGTTRGIAPLLLGLQAFDDQVKIAGVLLNRVAGARHESKLRAAVERYTDLEVLGALAEDADGLVAERHLGLIPVNEATSAAQRIGHLAAVVEAGVDLDKLLDRCAATRAVEPAVPAVPLVPVVTAVTAVTAVPAVRVASGAGSAACAIRVGIARDRAFGFYYPDDLEALQASGARLVPFDALNDSQLPAVDALFIGGGFPETQAGALEANASMRASIRDAVHDGLPVYAECGGLMYLSRSIVTAERRYAMVGALPLDVRMHRKPVGRGHVRLRETADFPWPASTRSPGAEVLGHEFHYSSLFDVDPALKFGYRVMRGHGVDGENDGIVWGNVLASYAHLRSVAGNDWPRRFVEFAARVTAARAAARTAARQARGGVLSRSGGSAPGEMQCRA